MKPAAFLAAVCLSSLGLFSQTPNCNTINVSTGLQSISASGVGAAAIVGMQVFNSNWATVANQTFTSPHGDVVTIGLIPPGNYFVNVRFYNNNWASVCERGFNVTVNMTEPPPPDTCTLTFQKTIGNPGSNEYPIDLVKTIDGGYAAAGMASSSGTTNQDALLMKFDSRGNLLWSKTFGGGQVDYFYTLSTTTGGGFIAGGSFNSTAVAPETYTGESWLMKLDANGNIEWQKKYTDNTNPGRIHDVIQTTDGGYAMVGNFPFMPGASDMMIIKTNSIGVIQWQKKVGVSSSDDGLSIVEDGNGGAGLVVTGNNYSPTNYDGVIVKLDLANGNVLWSRSYDLDGRTNRFRNIKKVNDGFVITAVTHDGWLSDNAVLVLIKTDFNGNILQAREVRAPGCGDGHLTVLNDGGYLFAEGEDAGSQNSDIHLVRADANGNVLWSKKYPRAGLQWINALVTDGHYIVGIGYTNTGSFNDVLLIKTHISGRQSSCNSVDETATTRTPVVTDMGSPFTVNASLSLSTINTTSSPLSVSLATTILCIDSCGTTPPPPPQLTISNVTVNENAGSAVLQVCISQPTSTDVMYNYTTANGTALSGSDYTGGSAMVTIPAGQTCASITIPILNDAIAESTETFTVSIGSVSGTVTINDDDQPAVHCNNISFNAQSNQIVVAGLNAPVITVQIFNSSWATVFNQTYTNEPDSVVIPIAPGTYLVKVSYYTSNWTFICDKSENVTVTNSCPPGAICISNICPGQSVNLNDAYSIPNLPAGTVVSWHTSTPATDANKLTAAQAQNVTASGTYYAAINIAGANCYSATIPVNVTIRQCTSAGITNAVQLKSETTPATRNVMVFPNPFTRIVRVVIDSEKKERISLTLTDVVGRQLKTVPVQLVPGSNTFIMEGLDQFPSGNYFLTIRSASETKTIKLMRQQ